MKWWNFYYKLKPVIHVLIPLVIWIFVVVLLANEQSKDVMRRLDQVHTYQLQKQPLEYDDVARPNINTNFQTHWTVPTDDVGCLGLTSWTGNAACIEKRTKLVTTTRQQMGCDNLRSPGCNCVNQVLSKIANDLTPGTNSFTGTFATTGKNLSGQQSNILAAIEACHFLHHPSYVAAETNTAATLIRRTGLLFLLSTMLTGNAVLFFMFPIGARQWGAALWRILGIIIWPIAGALASVIIESGASSTILLILMPPLLILIWYEFVLTSHHKPFFFHPYFFAVILATSSVISLIENSVFDYDNITYEIWKSHMVSSIYFAVYWFTAKAEYMHAMQRDFVNRDQQEAVMVAVGLAFLSLVTSAVAPYTSVAYTNYLMWLPVALATGAFLDVLWVSQQERKAAESQKTDEKDQRWNFRFNVYYVSTFFIILKAAVVIYYWRDYSTVYIAMNQRTPTRSIQYNQSNAWLSPTY